MYEQFTDAENTGAPLVPMVGTARTDTPDTERRPQELEEVVFSHRLRQ